MASFDLGAGGVGARIMMLLTGGRVALFTGEGKPRRDGNRLSLGPLALESQDGEMLLSFHGHARHRARCDPLSQYRARACLRMARRIDGCRNPAAAQRGQRRIRSGPAIRSARGPQSRRLDGVVRRAQRIGSHRWRHIRDRRRGAQWAFVHRTRAAALQLAPNDLGLLRRRSRAPIAIEMRSVSGDDGEQRSGRILRADGWTPCARRASRGRCAFGLRASHPIVSEARECYRPHHALIGTVENFIPLSRPGPDGTRIFTALGFAHFKLGDSRGRRDVRMLATRRRFCRIRRAKTTRKIRRPSKR